MTLYGKRNNLPRRWRNEDGSSVGPRGMEIWCETPDHAPTEIGRLVSRRGGPFEVWRVDDGVGVEVQRIVADLDCAAPLTVGEQSVPFVLQNEEGYQLLDRQFERSALIGAASLRIRFRCDLCGADVVTATQLGAMGGGAGVHERTQQLRAGVSAADIGYDRKLVEERGSANLSRLADAGVSRLSLVALSRILSM